MINKAKIKVEQFLNAWKENNHIKMYELTSKTWMAKHSKKQLKQMLPKRIKEPDGHVAYYNKDKGMSVKNMSKEEKKR